MKVLKLKKGGSKKFLFLAGINRAINPAQVTKLANSITKMGCIRPVVIATINFLGESGDYIIDGQHLFYALLRNDQDIPYVKITIKDKKDLVEKIALLNASSKNWTTFDYVVSWSCVSEEYVKLNEIYNTYDFDLGMIAGILMGLAREGGCVTTKIKSGTFKVVNKEKAITILDNLTDVFGVIPRLSRFENRYVTSEYISFFRSVGVKYNHDKFVKGLSSHKKDLEFVNPEPGKLSNYFKKLA